MSLQPLKSSVRDQFDRNAHHYLHGGPMDDRELLDLIVRLAKPKASDRLLDVACGAGLLVAGFAGVVAGAAGVDLSEAMLAEARKNALGLGLVNTRFQQGDGEALPFTDESFDIVTCKLALHYFPDPMHAMGEMWRVARKGATIILVDRVSSEDSQKQAYLNRIEKLRTPSKVKVYATSEISELLVRQGVFIEQIQRYEQFQDVDEWIGTTGAPLENQAAVRKLMLDSLKDDLAGLKLWQEGERLVMAHATVIIIAGKP